MTQSTAMVMSGRCSILWDVYPTLGCHDTQNVLHKCNHPTKPIRLISMNGLTKPHFLDRPRHERLTKSDGRSVDYQSGSTSSPSISPRPKWAGGIFPPDHPCVISLALFI